MAAPMIARGVLVGVLAVESPVAMAYDELDEQLLRRRRPPGGRRARARAAAPTSDAGAAEASRAAGARAAGRAGRRDRAGDAPVVLRHYAVDGSTFLDDDYVIKGVAGRLLWKVVAEHAATGRTSFTNREAKLDPTLELPEYRDNFESRLILLKRRLDEREAPHPDPSSGRGRFDLEVSGSLVLESVPSPRR